MINPKETVFQDEGEEVFEMLPRLDLLLVNSADEAELDLLGRQHQHDRALRLGVGALNRKEALV